MGRRRWTNRLTVEGCPLFLCVASFHRAKSFAFPAGTFNTSTVSWTPASGEWQARLECRIAHSGPTGLEIFIHSQDLGISLLTDKKPIPVIVDRQLISIATVRPHLGGERYWFLCGCGCRVGRLYLPFGQQVFRCRRCYNLTYWSAQRHNQRRDRLARNIGAINAMLHSKRLRRQVQGVSAFALFLRQRRKRVRARSTTEAIS